MNDHLPEGMDLRPGGFTMEALRRAKAEDRILQAAAVVCTEEQELLVDLGCCMGRIERSR